VSGTDLVTIARRLPTELQSGDLGFVNPDTGEALPARESSDRTILRTLREIKRLEERLREVKVVAGAVLRERHGVGVSHSAGYGFKVNESRSWPKGRTGDALRSLVADGIITQAEADRAMPSKPAPDGTQLKALIGRLVTDNPAAAQKLADACTKSDPSVSDIEPESVDGEAVEE